MKRFSLFSLIIVLLFLLICSGCAGKKGVAMIPHENMGPDQVVQVWFDLVVKKDTPEESYQYMADRVKEEYTQQEYVARIRKKLSLKEIGRLFKINNPDLNDDAVLALTRAILDYIQFPITGVEMESETRAKVHFEMQIPAMPGTREVVKEVTDRIMELQKSGAGYNAMYEEAVKAFPSFTGTPKVQKEKVPLIKENGKWYIYKL